MSAASAESPSATDTTTPPNGAEKVGVLLLHGLTGMPDEMRPVMRQMKRLGYQVEVPVLPGHGGTHKELLAKNWQEWLEAARQGALKLREQGCDQIYSAGLSMGAILSALLSLEENLSGIIMLSPTLHYDMHGNALMHSRTFQRMIRPFILLEPLGHNLFWTEEAPYGLRDPRLQRQITKAIEAAASGESNEFGLFRTYWGSLAQLWMMIDVFMKKAHKIKTPALIIASFEDTIVSVNNPAEAYNILGSEDKAMHWLTGCDHVLTLDLCKDQVAQYTGQFITRLANLPKAATA
jgi:carboxylesterase